MSETKQAATPAPAPKPTSEKLTQLEAEKKQLVANMLKCEPDTPEMEAAMEAVYKQNGLIKAEIAEIRKAEQAAKIAEARNAKLAVIAKYDEARDALRSLPKNAKEDERAAATDAFNAAKTALENLVIGSAGSTKAATVPGDKKQPGEKGATSRRIIEKFLANRTAGMNDTDNVKAIIASGESRGTTGAVVLAWQRENGEKQ